MPEDAETTLKQVQGSRTMPLQPPGCRKMALIKFERRALSNEIRAQVSGNIVSTQVAPVVGLIHG
ncbi:MAG TPA: hypothetical protein VG738_10865 [Chitinophagaceae bacterium]|nr:hypothetical protein [Chitinophagaceae bacterium]